MEEIQEKKQKNTVNCVGTYYGEAKGTASNGVLTYDYKYTYTLKADGTYTADYNGVSGETGTYVIDGNKLKLTHSQSYTPVEIDVVVELYIHDDCSYITIADSEVKFNLYKQ